MQTRQLRWRERQGLGRRQFYLREIWRFEYTPEEGIRGLMLGEILGTSMGDIWAEEVLWRFLLLRELCFESPSLCGVVVRGDCISGDIIVFLGVEFAESLGVLAENVGVFCSSSLTFLVSISNAGRSLVAASGSMKSPSSTAGISTSRSALDEN